MDRGGGKLASTIAAYPNLRSSVRPAEGLESLVWWLTAEIWEPCVP